MEGNDKYSIPHESNLNDSNSNESNLNDSDSIRIRFEFHDYRMTLHKFPKMEIFVFAKIEKLHYTRSYKFPKKEICFANHSIRFEFDSDSVNSDSIRIRFDSDRIEFYQFGFDSQITNPNPNPNPNRIRIES